MALNQVTGDVYVAEKGGGGRIARYDSSGAPLKFTEGPGAGTNEIPNSGIGGGGESSVAVDSSGGLLNGAIYARNLAARSPFGGPAAPTSENSPGSAKFAASPSAQAANCSSVTTTARSGGLCQTAARHR